MDACFYFQLHQPLRLRRYTVFDIGSGATYFDEPHNVDTLRRVAQRCYVPATRILAQLARDEGARVALSISGSLLTQLQAAPAALTGLQALVATGGVELLAETSHHSLASLRSGTEFEAQVRRHQALMQSTFGRTARVFRNTELLVSDEIVARVAAMGFTAMAIEGADALFSGRSPNHVYAARAAPALRLLPRHYRLSDDIAFRFSQRDWAEWPLTADKFAAWVARADGPVVNVFMDFETFGEHHDAASGILEFLRALPAALRRAGVAMVMPSDLASRTPVATLGIPRPMSWADAERDTSAWLGNRLQRAAHERLYGLYEPVLAARNAALLEAWRSLSTSDHFYYMSTKWHADGAVHTYFSPHATPYDAYISFMNAMRDLEQRVWSATGKSGAPIRKPKTGSRKPKAESRKPKAESRKPKAESRKPKAESGEPKAARPKRRK